MTSAIMKPIMDTQMSSAGNNASGAGGIKIKQKIRNEFIDEPENFGSTIRTCDWAIL